MYIYTFEQNHREYNPNRYLKTIGSKILYSCISLSRNDLQFSRIFPRRRRKGRRNETATLDVIYTNAPRGNNENWPSSWPYTNFREKGRNRFISNNGTPPPFAYHHVRIEMRSKGNWNDSRSSHKKKKKRQKERKKKEKLSFAFLAAIRFKHRTNGSIPPRAGLSKKIGSY